MFFGKKKQIALFESLASQSVTRSYWSIVRNQFYKNRLAVWSVRLLFVFFAVALCSNFIANDKPLYAKIDGQRLFPVFKDIAVSMGLSTWGPEYVNVDWNTLDYESVLRTPIPYNKSKSDLMNRYRSPFDKQEVASLHYRHWLGTDELGRDVLAGMIHGTRIAMSVGFIVMGIAAFIGFLLGALAGYFADDRLKASRARIFMNVLGLFAAFYYGFFMRGFALRNGGNIWTELFKSVLIFALVLLVFNLLTRLLEFIPWFCTKVPVAVDVIIMRLIEIMNAIPPLFFLLAAIPLFREPSVVNIMIILGLLSWPSIAQFVRGELIRVRSMSYVEAAQAMGFSEWRVIMKHALPNSLTPVLIAIAFGIAGAILAESSLSFLGIGVDPSEVTWGQLLGAGRNKFSAWWMTVFPGLAIFISVTIFNLIGEGLTNALDPKQKH